MRLIKLTIKSFKLYTGILLMLLVTSCGNVADYTVNPNALQPDPSSYYDSDNYYDGMIRKSNIKSNGHGYTVINPNAINADDSSIVYVPVVVKKPQIKKQYTYNNYN